MAPATITAENEETTVRHRAADAVRQAAHVAHEARLLKTLASDAVEDGVYAAKRAITHGLHELEDLRDSAAYRVKRAPLVTVGLAFAGGILLGVLVGRIGRRIETQRR
jgi:ElaB/YqjD/DUF883 family membrane-anchored ribosome-binding protein